jgi:dihydrofolate synthase/folylpolyglutamate synthase
MNTYPEFIEYLNSRETFGIKLGLDNILSLLEKLGSPQKKLHFIHVAGSNGKGSVCAMLSAVLNSAGIKTGLYTSPHLIDVKERIRVNETDITEEEILHIAKKVIPLASQETTYFEILTAIAIDFFYEKGVEIVILETGMGGRLDATNACFGEIAIITDISLEHTQYLGDTLEKIKQEKKAIIKKDSIAILAESLTNNFKIYSRNLDFQKIRIEKYDNIMLNLLGDHQVRNCALALNAIDILIKKGYKISSEAIHLGLSKVRWSARFQVLCKNPAIILDGAHNPAAAIVLRDTIEKYLGNNITLIIGMLKDKDYRNTMDILAPIANKIITVTPNNKRSLDGQELNTLLPGKSIEYKSSIKEAIDSIDQNMPTVITGSLYLAGEVLEYFSSGNFINTAVVVQRRGLKSKK